MRLTKCVAGIVILGALALKLDPDTQATVRAFSTSGSSFISGSKMQTEEVRVPSSTEFKFQNATIEETQAPSVPVRQEGENKEHEVFPATE